MNIKSIKIKNLQNLTIILKDTINKRVVDKLKTSNKKHTKTKIPGKVIVCNDDYIQKIIRNGGL